MSPIGRVFIVLNLAAACAFVGFAATYLQRQDDYNKKFIAEQKAHSDDNLRNETEIKNLSQQVNSSDVAKLAAESARDKFMGEAQRLQDDLTARDKKIADQDATLKTLTSATNGMSTEIAAFGRQAKDAFDKAVAAEAAKDAAVREKDDAVAQFKDATQKIAALEELGASKDQDIAKLKKSNGELDLLVSTARIKGFLDSMAVPPLAGTISHVAGNLVTIQINNNPTNAEIKPGYQFAVYDGTNYKGEARVTEADAEKGVAFARLEIVKGKVEVGDKANTKTN